MTFDQHTPSWNEAKIHSVWIWIWINNRQNLTSMSVPICLWHGAQLRLKRRDSVCVHCRLGQRIPLWDGSYKEEVLVLLSISRYVTELVVMLAAGSCICSCEDVIHWYCYFTLHYSEERCQPDLASPFLESWLAATVGHGASETHWTGKNSLS